MTNNKRVLILGGTGEVAGLAAKIEEIPGVDAIASFAGRTKEHITLATPSRTGGFGGATGLANYLRQEQIDFLIDATHPFAAQISFNAAKAASECGIPRLMLSRPAWEKVPGDNWIEVESNQAAANILPELAEGIFLTIGRQELPSIDRLSIQRKSIITLSAPKMCYALIAYLFLTLAITDNLYRITNEANHLCLPNLG